MMTKFWLFYLKETGKLYAYTSNKEYAYNFKLTRNMSKFIVKKVKLDSCEMNELYSSDVDGILSTYDGHTVDNKYKIIDFSLIMTKREIKSVMVEETMAVSTSVLRYVWVPPMVLNEKYLDPLRCLLYPFLHAYIKDDSIDERVFRCIKSDSLKIILSIYGELFGE